MIKRLASVLDVPTQRLAREVDERRRRSAHADHGQDGRARRPGLLPPGARVRVPRRPDPADLPAQLPLPVARRAGPRLRRRDLARRAEGSKQGPKSDYRGGDKIGKSGVEATFDEYLNGTSGAAQIRVDSRGRPAEPARDQAGRPARARPCGSRSTSRVQRAAERAIREGIALARANKQFNVAGGAIIALDPRDGAVRAMASYPDLQALRLRRADRPEEARAAREQRGREGGQLPRPQPRHAGRLPAGLDLEAGHRARRDAGAPPLAVLVDPVHPDAEVRPRQAASSRTGIRSSTGR